MLSGSSVKNSAWTWTYYDGSSNLSSFSPSNGAHFYLNVYHNIPYTLGSTPAFSVVVSYNGTDTLYNRIITIQNITQISNTGFYGDNRMTNVWNESYTGSLSYGGGTFSKFSSLALQGFTDDIFVLTYQSGTWTFYAKDSSNYKTASGPANFNWVAGDSLMFKIGSDGSSGQNFSTSYSGGFSNNSSAYIKWVRIYTYKLSSTEIENIYSGTFPYSV